MKTTCEGCDEQEAIYRLTLTDLDGNIYDSVVVCKDCYNAPIPSILSAPKRVAD